MKEKVEELVFRIIGNNSENLSIGIINQETLLLSEGSAIDSMTIVSIIVDLESELSDTFKKEISLSDDNAMSRKISPYTNVKNLVEYILELLN
jgi:acyl carrier protein